MLCTLIEIYRILSNIHLLPRLFKRSHFCGHCFKHYTSLSHHILIYLHHKQCSSYSSMKSYHLFLSFFLGGFFLLNSCQSKVPGLVSKPLAMGKINGMTLVVDDTTSSRKLVDTFETIFEAPYPVLPAVEPIFDVKVISYQELLGIKYMNERRTFLLVANLSDTASQVTKMVRADLGDEKIKRAKSDTSFNLTFGLDKWAKGQLIIYVFGKDQKSIENALTMRFNTIAQKINAHDYENLKSSVFGNDGENTEMESVILEKFGFNIQIPKLYVKAIEEDNFLWLRYDNKIVNQSIVIQKFPYKNESQWSVDSLIALRNRYGKKYITTGQPNAYMTTNTKDLPTLDYTYTHNGIFMREIRGIWETENDFMGGPYVSYAVYNKPKGELIFIDTFVYAPGEDKRDLVQKLDCIVKTLSLPSLGGK